MVNINTLREELKTDITMTVILRQFPAVMVVTRGSSILSSTKE